MVDKISAHQYIRPDHKFGIILFSQQITIRWIGVTLAEPFSTKFTYMSNMFNLAIFVKEYDTILRIVASDSQWKDDADQIIHQSVILAVVR